MTKDETTGSNSVNAAANKATTESTVKVANEIENQVITASAVGITTVREGSTDKNVVEKHLVGNDANGIHRGEDDEDANTRGMTTAVVTVNAEDESLKPIATIPEANVTNLTNETAVGEAELTANFPQKV
jgi:hypothetical protein